MEELEKLSSQEFDKLEKETGFNLYNEMGLTKAVLEKSIAKQARCLCDNLFYSFLKTHKEIPEMVIVDYYKNRHGIKNLLPISKEKFDNFAKNFRPEKKFWYFKVLGKRYFNTGDSYLKLNKLLQEFGSEKRLLLWHNKEALKKMKSQIIFGDCKEKEIYNIKIYDFATEDVRGPFSLAQIFGMANYHEIMLRRETSMLEDEFVIVQFVSNKLSQLKTVLLDIYLISKPDDITKEKLNLMLEERFENVLYHELGHNALFKTLPIREIMKLPPFAQETLADFMPDSEYGIGLLPRIAKLSKEDYLKAMRLWCVHYYRNIALFMQKSLMEQALIECSVMTESLTTSGIDFGKLENIIEETRKKLLKDPQKVLEEAAKNDYQYGPLQIKF